MNYRPRFSIPTCFAPVPGTILTSRTNREAMVVDPQNWKILSAEGDRSHYDMFVVYLDTGELSGADDVNWFTHAR